MNKREKNTELKILGLSMPLGSWAVLLVMFIPSLSDLVRKLLPKQPNWVVPFFMSVTLVMVFTWLLSRPSRLRIPGVIGESLVIWVGYALLYTLPSIYVDWRIVPATILFRFLPIFLILFVVRAIREPGEFIAIARIISLLPIVLLPVGIISMTVGNDALPIFLQPTKEIQELGRDYRAGFNICAGIYSTAAIMANSITAMFILTIATISISYFKFSKVDKVIFAVSLFADLILIFASARRGDFFVIAGVFLFFLGLNKKIRPQMVALMLFAIATLFFIDKRSTSKKDYAKDDRSNFMMSSSEEVNERLSDLFAGHFVFWVHEKPFGRYYGWAGRESDLFAPVNLRNRNSVEMGGAQLIAETGVFGAILMPLMLVIVWVRLWHRASRNIMYGKTVKILIFGSICLYILFYVKVVSVLANLYTAHIYFWMFHGFALFLSRKNIHSKYI